MERRKGDKFRSSPLPVDYLKMITEVFTSNFDAGLQILKKHARGELSIEASGAIYATEVVVSVSLLEKGQLAATTVYGSADFDPKASSPTVQDLLAACVDGIGAIYGQLLDPEHPDRIEQLASESLSALENIPFQWTEVPVERHKIFLLVDKANPHLETAKKGGGRGSSGGTLH
jgi:hypothetical protein